MPRPKSLWSKVVRPVEFRFDGWEKVLGHKRCFHVAGFNEIMRELGLHTRPCFEGGEAKIPTRTLAKQAVDQVPAQWKTEFGLGDSRRLDEWTKFGVEQVLSCNGDGPVLLQKAMIALIFAELVVDYISERQVRNGKPRISIDVYELLHVEPAVYWVKGFDENYFKNTLNTDIKNTVRREAMQTRLIKSTRQLDVMVFDEIARDGCTCLHSTAVGIIEALKKTPGIGRQVEFKVFSAHEKGAAAKHERVTFKGKIPFIPGLSVKPSGG